MSLVDLGAEVPFVLPESSQQPMYENPAWADYLANLNRPIGLIPPGVAKEFVVCASFRDEQRTAFDALMSIASMHRSHQQRNFGVMLTSSVTSFGDQVVSLLSQKTLSDDSRQAANGFREAASLLVVEDTFVVGHSHMFKHYVSRGRSIERGVRPLKRDELDSFNIIQAKYKAPRRLLETAS